MSDPLLYHPATPRKLNNQIHGSPFRLNSGTVGKDVTDMEAPIVVKLCKKFVEREHALGMKKGVKRDDAAMHYFVGAANALDDGCEDQRRIIAFLTFGLQYRGYESIKQTLAGAGALADHEVVRGEFE